MYGYHVLLKLLSYYLSSKKVTVLSTYTNRLMSVNIDVFIFFQNISLPTIYDVLSTKPVLNKVMLLFLQKVWGGGQTTNYYTSKEEVTVGFFR